MYIPYLWWHHVRSRGSVNALVNYWWERVPAIAGDPRNVLLHAMMAIRSLPAIAIATRGARCSNTMFSPTRRRRRNTCRRPGAASSASSEPEDVERNCAWRCRGP